jgi:indole-3-glycerol phosphate synthase
MKDIILRRVQLEAATRTGANAVLLIQALYDRSYGEFGVHAMIAEAHARRLEVLLEVHGEDEFQRATMSDADLVGINNRNLGTSKVDLDVTKRILRIMPVNGKIVVSESGIFTAADVRFLSDCGARAFLIGSVVMSADNIESKVREFTMVLQKNELKV